MGTEGGVWARMRARRPSGETVLLLFTIAAVVLGIGIGAGVGSSNPEVKPSPSPCPRRRSEGVQLTPRQLAAIKFPGEIFMRMLKLLILPLMYQPSCSCLPNDAGLFENELPHQQPHVPRHADGGAHGVRERRTREGRKGEVLRLLATSYYVTTTFLAVLLGIILVLAIRPGDFGKDQHNFDQDSRGCPGTQSHSPNPASHELGLQEQRRGTPSWISSGTCSFLPVG